jgi:hypothetical protein
MKDDNIYTGKFALDSLRMIVQYLQCFPLNWSWCWSLRIWWLWHHLGRAGGGGSWKTGGGKYKADRLLMNENIKEIWKEKWWCKCHFHSNLGLPCYVISPLGVSCVYWLPKAILNTSNTQFGMSVTASYGKVWIASPSLFLLRCKRAPLWNHQLNWITELSYQHSSSLFGTR